MTSTYTDSLKITKQGHGDNIDTWDSVVNAQFDLLDKSIAGVTNINVTGSVTVNMATSATNGSDSDYKRAVFKFTGIPTAHCSVTVPAVTKVYMVHSSLGANKNVLLHATGSSVEVTVGQSDSAIIYCDGTDLVKIAGASDLTAFGITATAAEINILDGVTATTAELNYLDGVTSNIQTQFANLTSVDSSLATAISSVNSRVDTVSAALTSVNSTITSISSVMPVALAASAGNVRLGAVKLQWGQATWPTTGYTTVTFVSAFSGVPYSIAVGVTNTNEDFPEIFNKTATGFDVRANDGSSSIIGSFEWIAIGPT
jgi:hypothetical protein